jgi:hypothetical protein
MRTETLVGIGIFTFAMVLTIYAWVDVLTKRTVQKEGFTNPDLVSNEVINQLITANEPVPTETEAIKAHQTLLRYIRNDFSKGIKFVMDFGKRFYGDNLPLRPDLDPRTLMVGYVPPI